MTEADYAKARALVIAREEPPASLFEECRRVVTLLIRTAGLPAHYSPYGIWNEEAIEEVLADWSEHRLIGRGQLLAIMQRAPVLPVFRRMAETSVRQHLIDSLRRSQAANLYERVTDLLDEAESFVQAGSDTFWRLKDGTAKPFIGEDRELASLAWSLGDFRVIRYQPEARKLSPLLERDDLLRFLKGLLSAGAMNVATIMRALRLRFAIDEAVSDERLDPTVAASQAEPDREVLTQDLATATLAELSSRQAEVLMGIDQGQSVADIATRLGCSTGTVSHERRQVEATLARLGGDAPAVLKLVLDALFLKNK